MFTADCLIKTGHFAEPAMWHRRIAISMFRLLPVADLNIAHKVESEEEVDEGTRGLPILTFVVVIPCSLISCVITLMNEAVQKLKKGCEHLKRGCFY